MLRETLIKFCGQAIKTRRLIVLQTECKSPFSAMLKYQLFLWKSRFLAILNRFLRSAYWKITPSFYFQKSPFLSKSATGAEVIQLQSCIPHSGTPCITARLWSKPSPYVGACPRPVRAIIGQVVVPCRKTTERAIVQMFSSMTVVR